MADLNLSDIQFSIAALLPKRANGDAGTIQVGSAVVTSSNPAVATIAQFGTDPLNFKITGVSAGTFNINYSVKNTAGTTINGTPKTGQVSAALTVSLDINFGAPQTN